LERCATHYFQSKTAPSNLKTGQLEPRTRDVYETEYLPYDYHAAPEAEKVQMLRTIIEQIHPVETFREGFLAWRGYCLTGERNQQCFVLNIGFTAENGKSTLGKMFASALPL
jgi:phage/plasmid-associated DNA primase